MRFIALSDLHGKKSSLREIIKSTGKGFDAVLFAGDLTTPGAREEALELIEMLSFSKPYCVPGNMDSSAVLSAMEEKGVSVHGLEKKANGVKIRGMGGGLMGQAGEILLTEKELEKGLLGTEKGSILLTHLPPKNSKLDVAGNKNIGSNAVKKTVLEKVPGLLVCGHAHGARGIEEIGKTLCVNPGPAKEGNAAIIKKKRKWAAELV